MLSKLEEKKQDPRVKRTRLLLQQALMDLMAEKSFQSITVQDIAERATVNRVTFYAHFADKQALLEYSIREAFRQQLHARLPEDAPYNPDNLRLLIQLVCEFLAQMSGHCPPPRAQFEPLMEKQVKAELYDVLKDWVEEMPPRNGHERFTPALLAAVNSAAIYALATQWIEEGQPEPIQKRVRRMMPWFLASLQAPRERQNAQGQV